MFRVEPFHGFHFSVQAPSDGVRALCNRGDNIFQRTDILGHHNVFDFPGIRVLMSSVKGEPVETARDFGDVSNAGNIRVRYVKGLDKFRFSACFSHACLPCKFLDAARLAWDQAPSDFLKSLVNLPASLSMGEAA